MVYFLGLDKMEEIKESCLDDIKCVEQYCMTEADFNSLWNDKIYVYNHAILCEEEEDLVKKIFYCGKLPQLTHTDIEFAGNKIVLDSIYESNISWKKRIILKMIDDKATLLSIHGNGTKGENIHFENGEFDMENGILFNHKFTEIVAAESNESYLAIVTGNLELKHKDDCWIFKIEKRPSYFILIKVIPTNESKCILLTEVFRINLDECFSNLKVVKIQFNINLSSKLLLIAENEICDFLITFDIYTLQFSSSLKIKECLHFSRHEVFYFYDHLLKDIIIFMDNINHVVYIVKKSLQNVLYIYKKSKVTLPDSYNIIYNIYSCNNRNNQIILFFTAQIEEEVTEKISIFVYNVFKDEIHGKLCDINGDESSPMFFNSTGEEILVAEKNESNDYVLNVFVYKSELRSLKTMCQMVVLQQYSRKQLHKMSLPKNIFKRD